MTTAHNPKLVDYLIANGKVDVVLPITLEEIKYLRDLLKIEVMFQIKTEFQNAVPSDPNLVIDSCSNVATIFDNYRFADDMLSSAATIVSTREDSSDNFNDVIFTKSTLMMFKILCEDTPKLGVPPYLKDSHEKNNSVILNKLNKILGPEANEVLGLTVARPTTEAKESSSNPDAVNIWGPKTFA
jgi:hypothetical protein